jgi:formylmethanofuran dehydrogenase subunit A
MSHGLLLQNGLVYDPLNGIDGEIMDISISGGRIAERVGEKARKIDLKGRVVMPGGVDLHSHIVGSKLGYGRAMCPEDHRGDAVLRTRATRGGVGSSMPTSYVTGYRYSIMGYTTVIEPALPAVQALSAWEELEDLPNLNSGMLTMLCNSMITLHYVKEGDLDGLAAYVAWILRSVGGLGVKAVNPGGTYAWAHGVEIHDIDQSIPSWEVTRLATHASSASCQSRPSWKPQDDDCSARLAEGHKGSRWEGLGRSPRSHVLRVLRQRG